MGKITINGHFQMDFEPDFPVLPAPASSDLHIQRLLQPFHMLLILDEPDEPVVERGSIGQCYDMLIYVDIC
jgi:hypothetical protein